MCKRGLWNNSAPGLLASISLDKLMSREVSEGRGAWIQAWVQDRGAMLIPKGSMNVCALVSLENAVCAGRSDLLTLPDKEQEGTWLAVLVFM